MGDQAAGSTGHGLRSDPHAGLGVLEFSLNILKPKTVWISGAPNGVSVRSRLLPFVCVLYPLPRTASRHFHPFPHSASREAAFSACCVNILNT